MMLSARPQLLLTDASDPWMKKNLNAGIAYEKCNEERKISGCPIDGAISVRVDSRFGSYQWFVYITTPMLRDASWILIYPQKSTQVPGRKVLCRKTITNIVEKFRNTGSVGNDNKGHSGRQVTQNVQAMREHLEKSPQKSLRNVLCVRITDLVEM